MTCRTTGNEDFMDGRPERDGGGGFETVGDYYIYIKWRNTTCGVCN
ncbi:MAG: hypothetical protein ACOWW1_10110 [archaeon]|nr:hypothetical protein [Candidatus Bathyarchaeum sp.]